MSRIFCCVLAIAVSAVNALAGVIYDVRTGAYADGETVPAITEAIVTYTGVSTTDQKLFFWCTESPSGEYGAISVWTDIDPLASSIAPGDVVSIAGAAAWEFVPTRFDLRAETAGGASVTTTGTSSIPWITMTYEAFRERPTTVWRHCPIQFDEGFAVSLVLSSYWEAISTASGLEAYFTLFDDTPCWFSIGDCHQGIRGFAYQTNHLYVYPEDFEIIDCALPAEHRRFGSLKAMYR